MTARDALGGAPRAGTCPATWALPRAVVTIRVA